MHRTILVSAIALVALAAPALAQEDDDPFASADDPFAGEEDPFAEFEREALAAENGASGEPVAAGTSNEKEVEERAEKEAPAPAASAAANPPAADAAAPAASTPPSNDTPGVGLAALVGVAGAAAFALRRRA